MSNDAQTIAAGIVGVERDMLLDFAGFERLNAELESLRASLARVEEERDEAVKLLVKASHYTDLTKFQGEIDARTTWAYLGPLPQEVTMKPSVELKHVKGTAYVLIVDPGVSNTAIYIKNADHTLTLMQPKGKRLDSSRILKDTRDVSHLGEAAARRAAFVVYEGGKDAKRCV